ncbi:high mobility group protein HMG-I/HMG-Y-like [Ixodes scapularis]|uniref:high mobility group protein HMG-I/HMG-Y-like n=1 Tax=Ixodes scapularis TaxID=6945 RepID=UPI001161A6BF|nr:high mobility group protein HMG-I/HMG-Y-like [Ixodes scapularis]
MADDGADKKRGRPKKSETGEKRAKEEPSNDEPKAKRGRGRPKGSIKKKKAAAKTAASPKKTPSRGRHRKAAADKDTGSDDAGGDQSD